jgi:hypothetical protein
MRKKETQTIFTNKVSFPLFNIQENVAQTSNTLNISGLSSIFSQKTMAFSKSKGKVEMTENDLVHTVTALKNE